MKEIPLTKRNRMERMIIACTLLTGIWEEVRNCEAKDIERGLLQNAVYAQTDINRIVWKLNELNGYEPQTDCCETCEHKDDGWDSDSCDPCSKAEINYEPKTDCSWK